MPQRLRWFLAACCGVSLLALLLAAQFRSHRDRSPTRPTARVTPSDATVAWGNSACRACHVAVWDEWNQSRHAVAWSSPDVQAAFEHFGHDRQCESCHAPEPVLASLDAPRLRPTERESGVDCISCHRLADGTIAAMRTLPDAPCRPVASAELGDSRHCGRCHVAAFEDWRDSDYARHGKTCQSCHAPTVADRSGGRSHVCVGGYDEAFVRSGVRMTCRQEGNEIVVDVENHATGHNFPGERHNRILLLEVVQRSTADEPTQVQQTTIKGITPFRGESSAEQIRAGQTYTARFPINAPAAVAEVQLLYKHFPWYRDEQAMVVHTARVDLK